MKYIYKEGDLTDFVQKILDAGFNVNNMSITVEVDNKEDLKNINENFYYTNNKEGKEPPEEVEEIDVNIMGVKIKYIIKEN